MAVIGSAGMAGESEHDREAVAEGKPSDAVESQRAAAPPPTAVQTGSLKRAASASLLNRWVRGAADALVSIFFPADCRLCEKLLLRASRVPICDECQAGFPRIMGAVW